MAGWLKVRKDLREDDRTQAIAHRLAADPDLVVGKLIRVWTWADAHAARSADVTPELRYASAVVHHLEPAWLDTFAGLPGIGEAMLMVDWLRTHGTSLVFPNFGEHNWPDGRDRAGAQARMAKGRAGAGGGGGAEPQQGRNADRTPAERNPHLPRPGPLPSCKGINPLTNPCTPEASETPSGAVLTFPTEGKVKEWHLSGEQLDLWRGLYPSLDVEGECRKALAWVLSKADHRKTAGGMARFLVSWLNRANDRPARPAPGGAPAESQAERIRRIMEERKS